MKHKTHKTNIIIPIILCLSLAVSSGWSYWNMERLRPENIHARLQQRFSEKERLLDRYAEALLAENINSIHRMLAFCNKNKIDPSEFAFFFYETDSLKAWSSNVVNLPNVRGKNIQRLSGFQTLDNTIAFVRQYRKANRTLYGLYILDSPYLPKHCFCDIGICNKDDIHVTRLVEKDKPIITDNSLQPVFSLEFNGRIRESNTVALIEASLWLITFILFILLIHHTLHKRRRFIRHQEALSALLLSISALMLFVTLHWKIPYPMFTSDLFSSLYYSSVFNSLGALYMGSCILLVSAIILAKSLRMSNRNIPPARSITILAAAQLLYPATFIVFFRMILNTSTSVLPYLMLRNMLQRSDNPLMLKFIFAISLCMIICAVLLLTEKCHIIFFRTAQPKRKKIRWCLISATVVWAAYLLLTFKIPKEFHMPFLLLGSLFYWIVTVINIFHATRSEKRFSFRYHTVSCLISILLLSFLLEATNYKRLQLSKESFANSLLDKKNPLIQYNLRELNNQLEEDDSLNTMLADTNILHNDIINYIQGQYVQPYFANDRKRIFLGRASIPADCNAIRQYNETFSNSTPDEQCNALRIVNEHRVDTYKYLLLKQFRSTDKRGMPDTVYIAIDVLAGSDYFRPNFLLNRNEHRLESELHRLSCAEYANGKMVSCLDFSNVFHLDMRCYGLDTLYNGMHFNYRHTDYYLYFRQPSHIIMLATEHTPLRKIMATFPYLALPALMLVAIVYIIVNFRMRQRFLLIKQRIQLVIVSMVIMTAIVGGIIFVVFIQKLSKDELFQNSMARSDMIMRMLPTEKILTDSSGTFYLERKLQPAFSRIPKAYVENINIYTLHGEAVFLLDKNLPIPQSPNRLLPEVIEQINNRQKTFYRDTRIGPQILQANILYKPLQNSRGEIIAYMSFPSRQTGGYIDHLFYSVLPTFLCIYLLLTILFAMLGSSMGNYLLASLTRIADVLRNVKLQSKNQKIIWKYDDEIGLLVKDYNRLVDDLEVSAELLARSERESSWKELAQQVAHEIKNPLTPMKLRTQQMQRQLHEGRLSEEQLESYTRMMSVQIDALTDIASSFSSLAKIRQGKGNRENLLEIMESAAATYEGSGVIEITHAPDIICADVLTEKEQMLRVFNNLIKNAIQAKREDLPQRIELHLSEAGDTNWLITVTDYGKGMNDEEKRHAFTPHFTTKSSGSGLGLAIVKNIVSDWGGSIRFESVKGKYTTFFITLPKYRTPDK